MFNNGILYCPSKRSAGVRHLMFLQGPAKTLPFYIRRVCTAFSLNTLRKFALPLLLVFSTNSPFRAVKGLLGPALFTVSFDVRKAPALQSVCTVQINIGKDALYVCLSSVNSCSRDSLI
jgi:hypothetical protein